jgi:hypothetical protein
MKDLDLRSCMCSHFFPVRTGQICETRVNGRIMYTFLGSKRRVVIKAKRRGISALTYVKFGQHSHENNKNDSAVQKNKSKRCRDQKKQRSKRARRF